MKLHKWNVLYTQLDINRTLLVGLCTDVTPISECFQSTQKDNVGLNSLFICFSPVISSMLQKEAHLSCENRLNVFPINSLTHRCLLVFPVIQLAGLGPSSLFFQLISLFLVNFYYLIKFQPPRC